jgi:hypothetical protein
MSIGYRNGYQIQQQPRQPGVPRSWTIKFDGEQIVGREFSSDRDAAAYIDMYLPDRSEEMAEKQRRSEQQRGGRP